MRLIINRTLKKRIPIGLEPPTARIEIQVLVKRGRTIGCFISEFLPGTRAIPSSATWAGHAASRKALQR